MKLTTRPVPQHVTQWYEKKPFGSRLYFAYLAYGGWHPGIDFGCPVATPVRHVVNKGRVIFVGKYGGYGLTVKVRCEWDATHAHEIGVQYSHLTRVSSAIKVGQLVTENQVIGYSGGAKGDPNAGFSTGPHLHFGLWDTSLKGLGKEHYVDPRPYFKEGNISL